MLEMLKVLQHKDVTKLRNGNYDLGTFVDFMDLRICTVLLYISLDYDGRTFYNLCNKSDVCM